MLFFLRLNSFRFEKENKWSSESYTSFLSDCLHRLADFSCRLPSLDTGELCIVSAIEPSSITSCRTLSIASDGQQKRVNFPAGATPLCRLICSHMHSNIQPRHQWQSSVYQNRLPRPALWRTIHTAIQPRQTTLRAYVCLFSHFTTQTV